MPYEQTNLDEDCSDMNDLTEIIDVRRVVLEQLRERQRGVDSEGVVWAELEGMIDCINNMYNPYDYMSGGSDKWQ